MCTLRRIASLYVSHIRQDEKSDRHKRADCRKGRHHYGSIQNIGAGIGRRVCETCSAVTIDLTSSYELAYPVVISHAPLVSVANR